MDLMAPDRLEAIQETTHFIIENEPRPEMKEFYSVLLQQIQLDWY